MTKKIIFTFLTALFFTSAVFVQGNHPEMEIKTFDFFSAPYFASTIPGEGISLVSQSIQNNQFFMESLRLNSLALESFEYGDYDTSAGYAEEAIRFARLSNEFAAVQLINEAKRLLDYANNNNFARLYPDEYNEGKYLYEAAVISHSNDDLSGAIKAAARSIEILSALELESINALSNASSLPKQYVVRTWAVERDCLWNIAGYPWVYGDPMKWRELYNANRSRMPEPDNPDLIEPGFILDIPSIRGEARQGVWNPNRP